MSSEVYKQQKFTSHNSGAGKTKIKVNLVPGEDSCSVCTRNSKGVTFQPMKIKARISLMRFCPNDPTTSPRSHLLASTMGNRISAYPF